MEEPHLHFMADEFNKICRHIATSFEPVSLSEFVNLIKNGKPLPKRAVVMTFDDGYRNNLTVAQPILNDWNLPHIMYVSTWNLESQKFYPTDVVRLVVRYAEKNELKLESINLSISLHTKTARILAEDLLLKVIKTVALDKVNQLLLELESNIEPEQWQSIRHDNQNLLPMDSDELKQFHVNGGEIGSHCHHHCLLHDNQSEETIREQLLTSRQIIEAITGSECKHLAYPNGRRQDISDSAIRMTGNCGYESAVSCISDQNYTEDSIYLLPRLMAVPNLQSLVNIMSYGQLINK